MCSSQYKYLKCVPDPVPEKVCNVLFLAYEIMLNYMKC